jgi:cytosine/adenosine deaminase-related metal-dependent hydrolase
MVDLDDSDIAKLVETGTHVAHCPISNARFASRICRVNGLKATIPNHRTSIFREFSSSFSFFPS